MVAWTLNNFEKSRSLRNPWLLPAEILSNRPTFETALCVHRLCRVLIFGAHQLAEWCPLVSISTRRWRWRWRRPSNCFNQRPLHLHSFHNGNWWPWWQTEWEKQSFVVCCWHRRPASATSTSTDQLTTSHSKTQHSKMRKPSTTLTEK